MLDESLIEAWSSYSTRITRNKPRRRIASPKQIYAPIRLFVCVLCLPSKGRPAPSNVGAVHVKKVNVDSVFRHAKSLQFISDGGLDLAVGRLTDASNTI
jgi:hypothetical protein